MKRVTSGRRASLILGLLGILAVGLVVPGYGLAEVFNPDPIPGVPADPDSGFPGYPGHSFPSINTDDYPTQTKCLRDINQEFKDILQEKLEVPAATPPTAPAINAILKQLDQEALDLVHLKPFCNQPVRAVGSTVTSPNPPGFTLPVRHHKYLVLEEFCASYRACVVNGTVLLDTVKKYLPNAFSKKGSHVRLGKRSFSLGPGKSHRIRVTLTKKGRALLKNHPKVKVKISTTSKYGDGTVVKEHQTAKVKAAH